MAYRFYGNKSTIKEMAGVLGVNRSAYYHWARNGVLDFTPLGAHS